jgi:ribulose-phosphate 3-epimerase
MKLSPSVLSADFVQLGEHIKKVQAAGGMDLLHIDVMDGHFVPNLSIGVPVVQSIRESFPNITLDVHLMIENPEKYIDVFCRSGADIITVHAETTYHLQRLLDLIKQKGKKTGVALNPATPLCVLDHCLEDIDMVLIMTVNPGFGGQKFIPQMLSKISDLRKLIDTRGLCCEIEVDGGITPQNIQKITKAGADIAVAGSAIFGACDIEKAVADFRKNAYQK